MPGHTDDEPRRICTWSQWAEYEDTYSTECGNDFELTSGTLEKNDMKFCCFCGKPLVVQYVVGDDEDGQEDA